ncbi:MAG: hypothetical protein WCC27_00505 [Acidobacteriaceae bacterium]
MEIIEAPAFTRYLHDYLNDEQYRALQTEPASHPEAGDVMPGTGGFRKIRCADPARGKGRRGGLRVIYYYFEVDQQIWMMTIYGKNEAADLSAGEKRALKTAIESETRQRAERHLARQRSQRR